MNRRRGAGVALIGLCLAALLGLWLCRDQILVAAMSRTYDRAFAADPIAALPDGLHVGLCGSGSPMPDPTRQGPASPWSRGGGCSSSTRAPAARGGCR